MEKIMGYCLSWLAVKDMPAEKIFKTLGLKKSEGNNRCPEIDFSYIDMHNGWHIVIVNGDDVMTAKTSWLKELSYQAEVISAFAEEHVMYSAASAWRDGKRIWFIEHNLERGDEDLQTEGTLPECFEEVHQELLNERKNDPHPCDYIFDVPIIVGMKITGYIHDRTIPGLDEEVYWELVEV
jgi:hypothetical protein